MAQQVCYWDGSTNTDWATAANWTGSVERVPLSANGGDIAAFDSRQTTKPTTGMTDGGASNSGHTDNAELSLIHFKPGYTGGIGTAALPLCTSAAKIIIEGTGTYYINCAETNQSTDTIIEAIIINNPNAIVYLMSNCNDAANAASFTNVYVLAGTLVLAYYDADTDNTGAAVGTMYVFPRNNKPGNVAVTIEKDAYNDLTDVPMNLYMANGTLTTDSMLGIVHLYGGTINYGTILGTAEADLNITSLIQHGGTFNWYPDDDGDATITLAMIMGGSFLSNAVTNNHQAKTITTLHTFEGAAINLANSKGNITVTNFYDYGADVITDYIKRTLTSSQYDQP